MSVPVSVVILTFNEELNVEHALRSVTGWSRDIHIVDCGSTDRTMEIARRYTSNIHFHPWTDWADQRNWVLASGLLKHDWVLYLDADERLAEQAANEIAVAIQTAGEDVHGFRLPFDFIFLGARIRNGMRPHLRLVRRRSARWVLRGARDYCSISGTAKAIRSRLLHEDRRGIGHWIQKLNRNASLEATALLQKTGSRSDQRIDHEGMLRKWIRSGLWCRIPPVVRALVSFSYSLARTVSIRSLGESLAYAFFFGLWYPILTNAKYWELRGKNKHR